MKKILSLLILTLLSTPIFTMESSSEIKDDDSLEIIHSKTNKIQKVGSYIIWPFAKTGKIIIWPAKKGINSIKGSWQVAKFLKKGEFKNATVQSLKNSRDFIYAISPIIIAIAIEKGAKVAGLELPVELYKVDDLQDMLIESWNFLADNFTLAENFAKTATDFMKNFLVFVY